MKKERLSNDKLVLKTLSDRLTAEFGRGFSRSNLQNMRLLFLAYCDRLPPKRQMPSGKLIGEKSQTESSASALAASTARPDQQPHFQLSWSQYVFLLSIADPNEYVKTPDERPTVGMILCKRKREALVELTLPKDANIHASQYQLYLPSKEDLKQRLLEWAGEEDEQ